MIPKSLSMKKQTTCLWDNCHKVFENSRKCLKHIRSEHNLKNGKSICQWDGCRFNSSTIKNHVKRHLELVEAVCVICEGEINFKRRFDLNKHLKQFHEEGSYSIDVIRVDDFDIYIARTPEQPKSPISESLAKILN